MKENYSDRLQRAMTHCGVTQYKLAQASGVPQPTISRILKGISQNPRTETLEALSDAMGVSSLWLILGEGPMMDKDAKKARQELERYDARYRWEATFFECIRESLAAGQSIEALLGITEDEFEEVTDGGLHAPDWLLSRVKIEGYPEPGAELDVSKSQQTGNAEERRPENADELEFFGHMDAWDSNTPLNEDEVELPLFREVELAAGGGATQVIENHGAKLRFAKSTLSRAGVPAEAAACAFVRGNSMEPVMPDGTCVGVNTADKTVKDGEIYAIDHGGMLRVKYLHRRPGGGIKIVSQNASEHPVEEVTAEEMAANVRVIGRVFWWSVLR
ncbi:XRE family transcriptional regulator [Marinobacter nauticus]|uniref:XRE family transcriptional regulator n=1 Tax=Marinobacter nauticus TaxID=2743 RepID=UPI00131445B2|nr:helix-turn-helix transcriptional regulator [Marinobacter nauticus]